MPFRRCLFAHGRVILMVERIGKSVRLLVVLSPLLEEICGKVEILLLPRGAVQPHEGELYFGMPAGAEARVLLHIEALVNIIGILYHRGEQLFVGAALVQGDRRLDEVPRAVQLVIGAPRKDIFRLVHLKVAVEIAAGKLARADVGDRLVRPRFQLRVGLFREDVGDAFQPFGDVAVPKDMRLVCVVADTFQRAEPARLLEAPVYVVQRDLRVQLLQVFEKAFAELHFFEIDRLHLFPPMRRYYGK